MRRRSPAIQPVELPVLYNRHHRGTRGDGAGLGSCRRSRPSRPDGPLAHAHALVGRDAEPGRLPRCCARSCLGRRHAAPRERLRALQRPVGDRRPPRVADRDPDHLRRGDGVARLRAADVATPPRRSRRRAARHPDLGRLAPAVLLHRRHLPRFRPPSVTSASSSALRAARSCSPGSTTVRAAASSPVRCGTASSTSGRAPPAPPRRFRGSRARSSTSKRCCWSGSSCGRAGVEKHRSSAPAEAARRRPGARSCRLDELQPLPLSENAAVKQRGALPCPARATAAAKGPWRPP